MANETTRRSSPVLRCLAPLAALGLTLLAGCAGAHGDAADATSDAALEDTAQTADSSDAGPGAETGDAVQAADAGDDAEAGPDAQAADTEPDTAPASEICDNGLDDDADELADCLDPDCAFVGDCGAVEICNNGVDDTGNALVDCLDPKCRTHPFCVNPCYCGAEGCTSKLYCLESEVCDNGVDDDGNGQIDCGDVGCTRDPRCGTPCETLRACMVERGCDCAYGIGCPPPYDPVNTNACVASCEAEAGCREGCLAELSAEDSALVGAYDTCKNENCPEGFCPALTCLTEEAACWFDGDGTCAELRLCNAGCPFAINDSSCGDACADAVSPQGYEESYVNGRCNVWTCYEEYTNSDPLPVGCEALSTELACYGEAPGCFPPTEFAGTAGCAGVFACLAACADLGADDCVRNCVKLGSLEVVLAAAPVAFCVIETCGWQVTNLTPACLAEAIEGTCAAGYAACADTAP